MFIFLIIVAIFLPIPATPHQLQLHPKYHLEWELTANRKSIVFLITVQTTGFVGLGISETGTMTQADIFIGGYNAATEEMYHDDYFSTENGPPVADSSRDWFASTITDNGTVTEVLCDRLLDTLDVDQDLPILDRETFIIWAFGDSDNITYHGAGSRGMVRINLVEPSTPTTTPGITSTNSMSTAVSGPTTTTETTTIKTTTTTDNSGNDLETPPFLQFCVMTLPLFNLLKCLN